MSEFKAVAKVSELQPGEKKEVRVGLSRLLLMNVGGAFYATGSRCTHLHLSLADGTLEGNIITCPHHGSKFDVTTGAAVGEPAHNPLSTYEVKVKGEEIYIGEKRKLHQS